MKIYSGVSWAIAIAAIAVTLPARAAFIYSVAGSTYSQNFDSGPTTPENASVGNSPIGWTDDNAAPGATNFSIPGWYLYHPLGPLAEGGFSGNQRVRIGAGTANTGAFMSYGASASTDRALGSLSSGTLAATGASQYMGLRLTNNTGSTLTQFRLSYSGEQWRDGGATTPVAQSLLFSYKVTSGAALLQDTGFTAEPTLNFASPVFTNTGSGAAVDGNVAGKLAIGPVTVTGLTWANGEDLWIRWADANDAGNDHGLAIDDVSFSANIPEPSSLVLFSLAGLSFLACRRAK